MTPWLVIFRQQTATLEAVATNSPPDTALYALMGALVGAVLTALVNLWLSRLNHKRQVERDRASVNSQLEHARIISQSEQSREGQAWLRNEKLRLYADYSNGLNVMSEFILTHHMNHRLLQEYKSLAKKQVPMNTLYLIASQAVLQKVLQYNSIVYDMADYGELNGSFYSDDLGAELRIKLNRAMHGIRNEMRLDLGLAEIGNSFEWGSK